MIVLFDTSTLIYLFKPDAPAPFMPGTQLRVDQCQARIEHLLAGLQKARAQIIIPTPVMAELLVLSGSAGPDWLRILTSSRNFRPAAFDILAAVECAALAKDRLGGRKLSKAEHAKSKFDEQIVAIARVEGAGTIYSDDGDIRRLAGPSIAVLGVTDLSLPPQDAQGTFDLGGEMPPDDPRPDAEN